MSDSNLGSRRPYLLRAMYDWMVDNGQTPFIVVDAGHPGVEVPSEHVSDGKIVLNIGAQATSELKLENDLISFSARFGGVVHQVMMPPAAVLGIYARESGQGMIFAGGQDGDEPPDDDPHPHLRVVK